MPHPLSLLYVTCASKEEARAISRTLLDEKLIACANVLPEVESYFMWEGELKEDSEVILLLKTIPEKRAMLATRIAALHSYNCPCILEIEPRFAHQPYVDWVRGLLTPAPARIEMKAKPLPEFKDSKEDDEQPPWD